MHKKIFVEKDYHSESSFLKYLEILKNKLPDFHIEFEVENQSDLSVGFHISYISLNEHIDKEFLNIIYSCH